MCFPCTSQSVFSVHVSVCVVLFLTLLTRSAGGWVEKDHFGHVQLHELLAVYGVIKIVNVCVCIGYVLDKYQVSMVCMCECMPWVGLAALTRKLSLCMGR